MDGHQIRAALEARADQLPADLRLRVYANGVINIDRSGYDNVQRADVDALRAVFAELGWTETQSWIPRQGASWLSDGVTCGVSFRVEASAS